MQLFIPRLETFLLTYASQYPRILLTVESLRFLKKKAREIL